MINQHINAINQEIGVTYSKHFTLVDKNKIPDKYKCAQELIDLQKDEKLIKLIRELIDPKINYDKLIKSFEKECKIINFSYNFISHW